MGGQGGAPAPNLVGGPPVQVPPFASGPSPAPGVQPPASMKSGTLQGIPSLQDTFARRQGGPLLFDPSQAFPRPPLFNDMRYRGGDEEMARRQPIGTPQPLAPGVGGARPGLVTQPPTAERLFEGPER